MKLHQPNTRDAPKMATKTIETSAEQRFECVSGGDGFITQGREKNLILTTNFGGAFIMQANMVCLKNMCKWWAWSDVIKWSHYLTPWLTDGASVALAGPGRTMAS